MPPSATHSTNSFSAEVSVRSFLKASAAGVLATTTTFSAPIRESRRAGLIDVNVTLGHWPGRELPLGDPQSLAKRLKGHGVQQAWAGSFEALLHKDLARTNERLVNDCQRQSRGFFQPFGCVNPTAPDWREEVRRCARTHRMRGVRLHPAYHGYTFEDPRLGHLLDELGSHGLVTQISFEMEDDRMMHPLFRPPRQDHARLADLAGARPGLKIVLLNALRTLRAQPLLAAIAAGNVWVEIGMLEGIGGLETLTAQIPAHRVLFGSHSPLFYFEAALLKLKESELTETQLNAIRNANARTLLG